MPSASVAPAGHARRSGGSRSRRGRARTPPPAQPRPWTCGARASIAQPIPETRPPPPRGTTTMARSSTSSTSSRPSVPCPATIAGSSKGWTKCSPASARPGLGEHDAVVERVALEVHRGAVADRRLGLGDRGLRRHVDLAGRRPPSAPRGRPPGRGCRPRRRRCRALAPSPRAASLAEAPRILNEPVRCRFSALRTTCEPVSSLEDAAVENRRAHRDALAPRRGRPRSSRDRPRRGARLLLVHRGRPTAPARARP